MNISEIFIRRPVATILLMAAIFLFGVMGYRSLPISDLPKVDFPTISVSASLPGASPDTMASGVATPLEKQFSTIAGIDSMSSTSTLGQTQITLQFSLDRNIDAAAQDVQAAITAAAKQLPANMPNPPTYQKINPSDAPILYLALTSSNYPLSVVDRYAETFLAQRISMVTGVAQVNVYGSQKFAVRVQANPDILASYGIGLDDIANAITAGNVNLPTGSLNGPLQAFLIQATGQLTDAEAYKSLVVTYRNGSPVRLEALGNVIDSVENNKVASWFNGTRGIVLAVQRQPGTNTIQIVDSIKKILPSFQEQLPAGIKLTIMFDRSQSIRAAVNEVKFSLLLAAFLVVMVIYLFLRDFRATFIPSIALPLSIIAAFGIMALLDFSLDNLSLLALTLVVGFVVDDAIVMLENIYRHKELGLSPLQAALTGSKEISFTIISMTISLMVVFVPVLFMGGILGRLLHEFGLTICIAIIMSGLISLTLTPMLCSLMLGKSKIEHQHKSPRGNFFDKVSFDAVKDFYARSLQWTLRHQGFILGVFFGTLILSGILFAVISKGFLPSEDTGQVFGYTEADPSVSFTEMSRRQQQVATIISQDPNVQNVMSSVGAGGASASANAGRIFIKLKPLSERKMRADDIIQELRNKIATVPGINIYLQNIATISIGKMSKSTFQYTLQDADINELHQWAPIFLQEINKLPGFQDVTTDLQYTGPQVFVNIDRDKASTLGVTAQQIEQALGYAYNAQQVSTIFTPIDTYEVILELLPQAQASPADLAKLYVHSNTGKLVPLSAVASFSMGTGPLTVNHQGQLSSVTISFNLKPGFALGDAVKEIQQVKDKIQPPASLIGGFQGTAQAFQSSMQGLGMLLIISILVIYIVLGMLYESFIHPLTILSGLPAAGVGALLALMLFHQDLNFYSFIGIIVLVGIVKKNAIIMIDFALEAQRVEQKKPVDAIYEACLIRFRPIMMTTFAALMGTLPVALAFGAGAESRRPLGIAVVGGLLFSQLLTLYITPVIYIYFEKLSVRVQNWREQRQNKNY